MTTEDPPIVSHRNHAHCLDDYVDLAIAHIKSMRVISPEAVSRLRPAVRGVMGQFLRAVARDFAKGAKRGIQQMADLIEDPDYAQKRNARRRRHLQEEAERRKKEARERMEAKFSQPNEDELQRERNRLERDGWWHRQELERIQKRLSELGQPIQPQQTGAPLQ